MGQPSGAISVRALFVRCGDAVSHVVCRPCSVKRRTGCRCPLLALAQNVLRHVSNPMLHCVYPRSARDRCDIGVPMDLLQEGGVWVDLVGSAVGDMARVAANSDTLRNTQVMCWMVKVRRKGSDPIRFPLNFVCAPAALFSTPVLLCGRCFPRTPFHPLSPCAPLSPPLLFFPFFPFFAPLPNHFRAVSTPFTFL